MNPVSNSRLIILHLFFLMGLTERDYEPNVTEHTYTEAGDLTALLQWEAPLREICRSSIDILDRMILYCS